MKKRTLVAMFLCGLVMSAVAAGVERLDAGTQETAAVLGELAQRSGLPEVELKRLLADCDASQQNMHFCAWRDQIAADRAFRRALTEKERRMPKCKIFLESKAASWIRFRDQSCDKSTKKWEGGSIRPTQLAACIASETESMTKRLENRHRNDCTFPW
jgi:uncharacterized protein YecT (DUF1311 family)